MLIVEILSCGCLVKLVVKSDWTVSLAATKQINTEAAVVTVLSELDAFSQ